MNKEFLDMRDFVKHDEFSVNEDTISVAVYREQLHRENGRNLNFKTQQQDICDFVNKLNNTVKEYELFIYWLKLNGFINDAILDTFQNILEYDTILNEKKIIKYDSESKTIKMMITDNFGVILSK